MGQMGFFDLSRRYEGLDSKRDPLPLLNKLVPWEAFRPQLRAALLAHGLRTQAGGESAHRFENACLSHQKIPKLSKFTDSILRALNAAAQTSRQCRTSSNSSRCTNVKFVGKKFLSVHSGSNVPDVTISGSDISAEDTGCELRYAPVKPIAHRGAQTRRGSGKTYSFAQVRIGVNT